MVDVTVELTEVPRLSVIPVVGIDPPVLWHDELFDGVPFVP